MKTFLFFLLAVVLVFIGGFFFLTSPLFSSLWPKLLVMKVPLEKADCLILLGGEQEGRPIETALLYKSGVAPQIFITGTGDYNANKKRLLDAGVPASAITVEPAATTTLQNARFMRPLLAERHLKSAMIITSSFHMRRALAVFQHEIPGVTFGVAESNSDYWKTVKGKRILNINVVNELCKIVYYWVAYGIAPFPRTPGKSGVTKTGLFYAPPLTPPFFVPCYTGFKT